MLVLLYFDSLKHSSNTFVVHWVHKCYMCIVRTSAVRILSSKLTNDNRHLYFRCKKAVCMLKAKGAIEDLLIGSLNDISDAT